MQILELSGFKIDLFAKAMVLVTFSYPEKTFPKKSADSVFRFGFIARFIGL